VGNIENNKRAKNIKMALQKDRTGGGRWQKLKSYRK